MPRAAGAWSATLLGAVLLLGPTALPAAAAASAPASTVSAAPTPSAGTDGTDGPAAAASGELSWGVAPGTEGGADRAHFDYSVQPGSTVHDSIVVTNHSDSAITLEVYASDAFTTAAGGIDLLAEGTASSDVGTWIALGESRVTLAAGQGETVPFTLTVPANATPGDHAGGVVTSLVQDGQSGTVRVDHRLGSRVYVRVAGQLAPALAVSDVRATYVTSLDPVEGGEVRLHYTVTNTGNVRVAGRPSVSVHGPAGLLGRDVTLAELPEILPGSTVDAEAVVHGVWPSVRVTTDLQVVPLAGTDGAVVGDAASASETRWAPPWPQAVVLALVALVVWLVLRLRRRRRRAVDAAIADAVAKALHEAEVGGPRA